MALGGILAQSLSINRFTWEMGKANSIHWLDQLPRRHSHARSCLKMGDKNQGYLIGLDPVLLKLHKQQRLGTEECRGMI
jgi:hypothetical protein